MGYLFCVIVYCTVRKYGGRFRAAVFKTSKNINLDGEKLICIMRRYLIAKEYYCNRSKGGGLEKGGYKLGHIL